MGERLVISVIGEDEEIKATCYYHWGGFTRRALKLGIDWCKDYQVNKDVIKAFNYTGAKLSGSKGCNRNDGIIDIDKNEINEALYLAEEIIIIHLKDNNIDRVDTAGLFGKYTLDNYMKDYEPDGKIPIYDNCNFSEYTIDDMKTLLKQCEIYFNLQQYTFKSVEDIVFQMVE